MKKLFVALLVVIGMTGCAVGTYGSPFDWNNARQLKAGMPSSEVTKLIGKPTSIASRADNTQVWLWIYANGWSGSSQHLSLMFRDDKVVQVPKIPDTF